VRMGEEGPPMKGRLRGGQSPCYCPLAAKQNDN
jgi:hypothetical protein